MRGPCLAVLVAFCAHAATPDGGTPPAPPPPPALDKDAIEKVILEHLPAFAKCYEAALKRDPKLTGKQLMHFTIGVDGKVSNCSADLAFGDKPLRECMVEKFSELKFPPSKDGPIEISYPLVVDFAN